MEVPSLMSVSVTESPSARSQVWFAKRSLERLEASSFDGGGDVFKDGGSDGTASTSDGRINCHLFSDGLPSNPSV